MTAKDITAEDRAKLDGHVSRILQKGACGREELLAEITTRIAAPPGRAAPPNAPMPLDFNSNVPTIPMMKKLLLVEDNEMNRDMLSRRLARKGYEVLIAVDGAEGIASATQNQPDLIIMDMSLPVLDGWESTRRLKEQEATKAIPVLALTAHAMSGERERALAAGCNDYDTKPVDFTRLIGKIESLLPATPM